MYVVPLGRESRLKYIREAVHPSHVFADDRAQISAQHYLAPSQVVPDSGSSNFWISSAAFNSSRSSTFAEQRDRHFRVDYGSGAVSGNLATDIVRIGGIVAKDHLFGLVEPSNILVRAKTVLK